MGDSGGRLSREHGRRFKDRGSGVVSLPLRGKVHRRDGRHRKRLSPSEDLAPNVCAVYTEGLRRGREPLSDVRSHRKKPAANGNEIRLRQVLWSAFSIGAAGASAAAAGTSAFFLPAAVSEKDRKNCGCDQRQNDEIQQGHKNASSVKKQGTDLVNRKGDHIGGTGLIGGGEDRSFG